MYPVKISLLYQKNLLSSYLFLIAILDDKCLITNPPHVYYRWAAITVYICNSCMYTIDFIIRHHIICHNFWYVRFISQFRWDQRTFYEHHVEYNTTYFMHISGRLTIVFANGSTVTFNCLYVQPVTCTGANSFETYIAQHYQKELGPQPGNEKV